MKMKIAVLPGDGIGPEIIAEGVKVLKAVAERFGHEVTFKEGLVGAVAIDAVGNPYPDTTHELCLTSDAVLFGAVGHPRFDKDPNAKVRPEQGLLAMRKKLGLYANLRPVKTFDQLIDKSPLRAELIKGVDFMCVRELTGGLYFGRPQGRSEDNNTAYDTCVYSREEIARVVRVAYGYAMIRRKKLTVVDKANILATSRLWREVAQEIALEFPEVTTEFLFVDNAAMRMIQWPKDFDVLVTENMFGDILTDEGSVLTGSMGLLPSASIGVHTSVFEPIHGSWPEAAGKQIANPLATILSVAMLFEYAFHLTEEGNCIRQAVNDSLDAGVCTPDLLPNSEKKFKTSDVGDWIVNRIKK
ncbi:MAG: 3-isopropylmalate dehydrogenase [Bacteroidaceae bacterium]